jgi:hypothetical protein
MNGPVSGDSGKSHERRPGPFGPARALLPKDQQPLVIRDDMLAYDAIDRMVDNNYSQLPVEDKDGRIVGVFTWKSFSKRVADLRAVQGSVRPLELPVREALEPTHFMDPEAYLNGNADWSEIDYILVGDDSDLLGVLSIADVQGRLNDFAEAFVLLYEIEHEIRDLIHDTYRDEELSDVLDAMVASANRQASEAIEELKRFIEEKGTVPAVGKAIRVLRSGMGSGRLERLEDLTFAQYRSLICCETNWPRFEALFGAMREVVNADLGEINDLRNTIFHFRRGISPRDTDRLRRFRDKLRYNRELFERRQANREDQTHLVEQVATNGTETGAI